jgi:hypothetical protein
MAFGGSTSSHGGFRLADGSNLMRRQDDRQSHRCSSISTTLTLDATYDLAGNLPSRSDVGSYIYHATKNHAVTAAGSISLAYDANGNVTTRNGA